MSNCSALYSISFSVPIYRYIKLLWTLQFTKCFFLCSEMLFFYKWIYLFVWVYTSQPLTWDERNVRHWAPCFVSLVLPCLCSSMDLLSNEEISGMHRCCVVVPVEVYVQTLFRTYNYYCLETAPSRKPFQSLLTALHNLVLDSRLWCSCINCWTIPKCSVQQSPPGLTYSSSHLWVLKLPV